ncbi:MAG: GntR family transcriptional regulator [Propionibacteriaceae bacterium]|jgi:GntR family transcriptional regulator|nr:GntR family transcriptional regulator [Propionibacteriaceae bacterium]
MPKSSGARLVDGPQPKHQQLRDQLVAMVVPGQAIPSERDLMTTYGVSRATVRRAIDGLVADGLLQRIQGLGTFAVRPRLETRLHLASFSQDMRRRGRNPSTRLLSLTLAEPPTEVAAALALGPEGKAWHLVRVRLADNEPVAHEDGWYPGDLLPELDRQDVAGGSLYEIFGTRYGLWVDHAEQTLWGESADASLARTLAAPQSTPLLVFRRVSRAGGRPIEYVVSRYRGDRYQVHMELSRDDLSPAEPTPKGSK